MIEGLFIHINDLFKSRSKSINDDIMYSCISWMSHSYILYKWNHRNLDWKYHLNIFPFIFLKKTYYFLLFYFKCWCILSLHFSFVHIVIFIVYVIYLELNLQIIINWWLRGIGMWSFYKIHSFLCFRHLS